MPNQGATPKKQFSLSILARILIAVVVISSIAVFTGSMMRYNEKIDEKKKLEEEIARYQDLKEELQEILNSEENDEYIVSVARELWNLYFPDEEVYYNDDNG